MIVVMVGAGLGNQLFHYAFAKLVEQRLGVPVYLLDRAETPHKSERKWQLDCFNISIAVISYAKVRRLFLAKRWSLWRKCLGIKSKRIIVSMPLARDLMPGEHLGITYSSAYHRQANHLFHFIDSLSPSTDYLLEGNWQYACLVNSIEKILRKDIQFVKVPGIETGRILEQIKMADDAVAIHMRRNWYDIKNKYKINRILMQEHLSTSYYQKAIEYIKAKVDSPRFFVFADNIQLASALLAELDLGNQVVYVDSSARPGWEDLYLMQHCKHFILSNSTFGWWGCWLAPDKKGIRVMPDNWLGYNMGTLISDAFQINDDVIRL